MKNVLERELTVNNFKCYIRLNTIGCLCGYVVIPKNHKYYNVDAYDIDMSVHRGLSYGTFEKDTDEYVIGFDCGHSGDHCPAIASMHLPYPQHETWRNEEYVENELDELTKQLGIPNHNTSKTFECDNCQTEHSNEKEKLCFFCARDRGEEDTYSFVLSDITTKEELEFITKQLGE